MRGIGASCKLGLSPDNRTFKSDFKAYLATPSAGRALARPLSSNPKARFQDHVSTLKIYNDVDITRELLNVRDHHAN